MGSGTMMTVQEQLAAVLVVEDNPRARAENVSLFRDYDIGAVGVGSVQEALEYAKNNVVGVVVMDIALGDDLDGIELAAQIQELHPWSAVIFVAAAANAAERRQQAATHDLRIAEWFDKPMNVSALVAIAQLEVDKCWIRWAMHRSEVDLGTPNVHFLNSIGQWDAEYNPEAIRQVYNEITTRRTRVERRIERLYSELEELSAPGGEIPAPEKWEGLHEELRQLLNAEADEAERVFMARMDMPIGEVRRAIDEARRALES